MQRLLDLIYVYKPKKSILHKNKNKIVSPKSVTKIQRLRACYNHVHTPPGFPLDYFDNFPVLKPCRKPTRIMYEKSIIN